MFKKLLLFSFTLATNAFAFESKNWNFNLGIDFGTNITGYNTKEGNIKYSYRGYDYSGNDVILNVKNSRKLKVNKALPIADIVFGCQYNLENFIVGINFGCGKSFSSTRKNISGEDLDCFIVRDDFIVKTTTELTKQEIDNVSAVEKIKQQFHLYAAPFVAFRCTEKLSVFTTCGIYCIKHKFANEKGKSKIHPMAGVGVKYQFDNNLYLKLEYNHIFRKNISNYKVNNPEINNLLYYSSPLSGNDIAKTKSKSDMIKFGIGYAF